MRIQHQTARTSENFPVASWLLPEQHRDSILIFYDFVRGLDNIADDGALPADQRLEVLTQIKQSLESGQTQSMPPWVARYAKACNQRRIQPQHGAQLMKAFIQDTQKHRYESWQALLDYCQISAAPVGRFMLDLHGEVDADFIASDALCTVLQTLNHLQDMKDDYRQLNRLYWSADMMAQYGVREEMLIAPYCSPELRQLMEDIIARCGVMLDASKPLMTSIKSKRLRLEIGWIYEIARSLSGELLKRDPLAGKVKLSKMQFAWCLLRSIRWL